MIKMELTSLVTAGIFWLYKLDNRLMKFRSSLADSQEKSSYARRVIDAETHLALAEEKMAKMEEAMREMEMEKENLQQNLLKKSQEIANLLISTERKNKAFACIKKYVQEAIGKVRLQNDKSLLTPLLNMNMEISENLDGDAILEKFEEEFNFSNNDFLHRLTSQYPHLTQNERKTCIYLRMERSTKEIATLLHLSVRGVETIRYNLRKKLNLTKGENLSSYLNEF